jgi:hypothetical protein
MQMFKKLVKEVVHYLRSFWMIDVHRGAIDILSDDGYVLTIPFNAQCRQRKTGTRYFYRLVFNHAHQFSERVESKLIKVRLQEKSVLGKVVIFRNDPESADAMSVETITEPRVRDIAMFGDVSLHLVNL